MLSSCGTGQTRQHGVDTLTRRGGNRTQTLQLGLSGGQHLPHFFLSGDKACLKGLALGSFTGQLLAQIAFGLLGLHFGAFQEAVVIARLLTQSAQFGIAVGATLRQRLHLAFTVIQTNTQRITLGVKLPGALHQLPYAGGELI